LHSFVKKRVKNITPADPPEIGKQWIWIAFARSTKLIVSWHVGKRDEENAVLFMLDMRARLSTVPILSTDGLQAYLTAVGEAFFSPEQPPGAVHFGQVVKSFTNNRRDYDKVAPAHGPPRTTKRIICGTPDIGEISTSITEREMLALRTNLRRLVRRGSGHSKSLEHHTAAVAAFATWANFCRPSSALKGKTPAMVYRARRPQVDDGRVRRSVPPRQAMRASRPGPARPPLDARGSRPRDDHRTGLAARPACRGDHARGAFSEPREAPCCAPCGQATRPLRQHATARLGVVKAVAAEGDPAQPVRRRYMLGRWQVYLPKFHDTELFSCSGKYPGIRVTHAQARTASK